MLGKGNGQFGTHGFSPWKQWLKCGPTSGLLILQWFEIHSSCSSEKMVLAPLSLPGKKISMEVQRKKIQWLSILIRKAHDPIQL